MKKDMLTLLDLSREDFQHLFQLALKVKEKNRKNILHTPLSGKTLGLIFDKASTRTRLSIESAMAQLGGTPIFISPKDTQMARNEPVRDTARVLSRYLDGLAIRTYSQDLLQEFAQFSDIPVINALTDRYHPTQVLSDILTIIECKGGYEGLKITWIGDGNNMSHSWINAAAVLGLKLTLGCPEQYFPDTEIMEEALEKGEGNIVLTNNPFEAVKDSDVVYTDVWASMGQEGEYSARKGIFEPCIVFQPTGVRKLVKKSWKDPDRLSGTNPRIKCI